MVRIMEMQDDLFHLGILQSEDEDTDDMDLDDYEEDFMYAGPYKVPLKDVDEEARPAFHSGIVLELGRHGRGGVKKYVPYCLLPVGYAPFRGVMEAPKEWFFRQRKLPEWFRSIDYELYLKAAFRSDQ
jgi:hypothetical protein